MKSKKELLKQAASSKPADRAAALKELKRMAPGAASFRYVEDLTDSEISNHLHILENGTAEQIAALPPLTSRLHDFSNLTDDEISKRLERLEKGT